MVGKRCRCEPSDEAESTGSSARAHFYVVFCALMRGSVAHHHRHHRKKVEEHCLSVEWMVDHSAAKNPRHSWPEVVVKMPPV